MVNDTRHKRRIDGLPDGQFDDANVGGKSLSRRYRRLSKNKSHAMRAAQKMKRVHKSHSKTIIDKLSRSRA